MKNLSMISKPQTGYTVKKANARKNSGSIARHRQSSYERFMQERANTNIYYVGVGGGALVQLRA